jgi:predicted RNA-binding Zn ribbon-like protein
MSFASENGLAHRPEFIFVGDHPAVDFANTLAAPRGYLEDLLLSWADVVEWLSKAGLSTDPSLHLAPLRGLEALKSVVELRQAWKAELAHLVDGGKVSDGFLDRLNQILSEETFHETLHREGKKGFHLHRAPSPLRGEKLAIMILTRQIALFLAEANLKYLHRCANTASCVLYFYDTTKNHRRQWCSVAACGNRHKVAQFRKRQAKAKKG